MAEVPSGTVTFLFTDIEGSTTRWEQHQDAMRAALARHDVLLQAGITAHGGVVVTERGEGDSFFALFARPSEALAAACALQHALVAEPWPPEVAPLRVRMALHTGEAGLREGADYRGTAVNRCARLRAAAHGGQVLLSGATYELVRDHLPEGGSLRDLGEHRLKDLTRPEHIFQVLVPGLSADFPPLKTLDRQRHNLPMQPTALVGREREVAALCARLLEPQTRLLTLTGPGGTGKTRLALQVAAEVLDACPDGAFFVDLAPISDPVLLLPTIAQTLGVVESGSQPLRETLHAFLQGKRLLLLLDNFERLLEAAPLVADLLTACAGVRVLVTSRAALHLRGERLSPVPPLALPELAPLPSLDRLMQYAAVRLFLARARDVKPDFAVTTETAPAVAEICVRLDGLPLAIELAAARVRLFSPPALLSRLSHRLGLLTGGARDLPARQRTLRATIDWSNSLLTAEEQTLLARLGVFSGGRALEAIEAICNAEGTLDVLGGVDSLLEKSLLVQTEGVGQTRFVMLETIQEYARERLAATGEAEALRQAHAAYFLALAEEAAPHLRGPDQLLWLARLDAVRDDLRTAWHRHLDAAAAAEAGRLWRALEGFWYLRGPSEGWTWLQSLLALPALSSATRAHTLAGASSWAYAFGAIGEGLHLAEEALALSRQIEAVPAEALALWALGSQIIGLEVEGGAERARPLLERALMLQRTLGDRWLTGILLSDINVVACVLGDLAAATQCAHDLLAMARDPRDLRLESMGREALGLVAATAGDALEATRLWEGAIAAYEELGDGLGIAMVRWYLGSLAARQGRYAEGRAHHLACLRHLHERGVLGWALRPLIGLAICLGAEGDAERRLRLAAAILACYEAHGYQMLATHREELERVAATARGVVGARAAAVAWAEGQSMTLAQAVAYAVKE
jgi:predicted ATPase/class 3 adenylate cyclase